MLRSWVVRRLMGESGMEEACELPPELAYRARGRAWWYSNGYTEGEAACSNRGEVASYQYPELVLLTS